MKLTTEQREAVDQLGKLYRSVLMSYKNINKFSNGDYLIKKVKEFDHTGTPYWKTKKFGKNMDSPRKYKIVGMDEFGIPFYKKVLFNGKLCDKLKYMGNGDARFVRFYLDPDMQDFMLLGGDIDKFEPMYNYKNNRRNR